jgi:hypothetical protein
LDIGARNFFVIPDFRRRKKTAVPEIHNPDGKLDSVENRSGDGRGSLGVQRSQGKTEVGRQIYLRLAMQSCQLRRFCAHPTEQPWRML